MPKAIKYCGKSKSRIAFSLRITNIKVRNHPKFCHPERTPDFLHAAPTNGHVCGFKESRIRPTEITKPDRKSGGSRGTCSFLHRQQMRPQPPPSNLSSRPERTRISHTLHQPTATCAA